MKTKNLFTQIRDNVNVRTTHGATLMPREGCPLKLIGCLNLSYLVHFFNIKDQTLNKTLVIFSSKLFSVALGLFDTNNYSFKLSFFLQIIQFSRFDQNNAFYDNHTVTTSPLLFPHLLPNT